MNLQSKLLSLVINIRWGKLSLWRRPKNLKLHSKLQSKPVVHRCENQILSISEKSQHISVFWEQLLVRCLWEAASTTVKDLKINHPSQKPIVSCKHSRITLMNELWFPTRTFPNSIERADSDIYIRLLSLADWKFYQTPLSSNLYVIMFKLNNYTTKLNKIAWWELSFHAMLPTLSSTAVSCLP